MERLNKLKQENIEKIIENLEEVGYQPTDTRVTEDVTQVFYDSAQIIFHHHTGKKPTVSLYFELKYKTKFNQENVDYLNKKQVHYWSIYKGWLETTYVTTNEKDLEETVKEFFDKYY